MKFKNHSSRLIKNELKEKILKLIKIVTERMITALQSDLISFKPYNLNHKLITYKLSTQSPKPKTLNSPLALTHTHAKTKRNNPT